MKRLLVIAAWAVLFSVNAGATFRTTDQNGMVTTSSTYVIPAGGTATERFKVHYETVNSGIMVDYTVSLMAPVAAAATGGHRDSITLNWLSVNFISPATKFTTNNEIDVSVNTAGLAEGSNLTGVIQYIESGVVRGSLTVNLTVTSALPRTAGVSPEASSLTVAANQIGSFLFNVLSALLLQSTSSEGIGTGPSAIGEVNWTASVTLLSEPGTDWLTISPTSGTATPDNPSQVTGTVDATKLPGPGTYHLDGPWVGLGHSFLLFPCSTLSYNLASFPGSSLALHPTLSGRFGGGLYGRRRSRS